MFWNYRLEWFASVLECEGNYGVANLIASVNALCIGHRRGHQFLNRPDDTQHHRLFLVLVLDVVALDIIEDGRVGVPKGQAPPHDGATIEENVQWWYRAKVKNPTDSISSLAEEYATRENRVTDCRSVIQIGIERAETLLEGKFAHWAT